MKKKIVGAIIALAVLAALSLAAQQQQTQQPQPPMKKPANIEARLAKWKTALNLDETQVAAIKKILENTGGPGGQTPPRGGERMGNPPAGGGMGGGAMRGGMGGMMGGRIDREVEAVLKEAQIPKFRALRKTERVEQDLGQLTQQLTLSPAQAAKIKVILAASADKEAEFTSVPQGEGPPDFEAMQALRQKRDAEISALLTAEQKKIFEETRQQGPGRRR
jgi:Spy/CpxP family protein refolding chaperone